MKRLIFVLSCAALALQLVVLHARVRTVAAPAQVVGPVGSYRRANEHRILSEFVRLLSIPNVAADRENIRLQNLWDGIETYAALMMMKLA
jgi:hypothetical protein